MKKLWLALLFVLALGDRAFGQVSIRTGTPPGSLQIGNSQYDEQFDGVVDQVRVYNYALTPAEINANITSPIAPIGAATIAINSPSSTGNYVTSANSVTISGDASCATAITDILWVNNRGGSGAATTSPSWTFTASGTSLTADRVNQFTVQVLCTGGDTAYAVINVRANGPDRAVLLLSFDENTGTTAADSSGLANTATFAGTGSTWRAGQFGSAVNLNGSGWLTVNPNNSLDLSIFTLSAFVFPTNLNGTWQAIVGKILAGAGFPKYFLYGSSSDDCPTGSYNGGFIEGASVTIACSSAQLQPNVWQHLTVTYDGSEVILYRNATSILSINATQLPLETPDSLLIGSTSFAENWNGGIDELRVYNYALPVGTFDPKTDNCLTASASVTRDYNCRIIQAAPPTAAVWRLYPSAVWKWYPTPGVRTY